MPVLGYNSNSLPVGGIERLEVLRDGEPLSLTVTPTAVQRPSLEPQRDAAGEPVLGPDGLALGALSVSGWANRMRLAAVAPAVHTAALTLSRTLGQSQGRGAGAS